MTPLAPLAGVRLAGESGRAVMACNDYLRMGPRRSLRRLLREYSVRQASDSDQTATTDPPDVSSDGLNNDQAADAPVAECSSESAAAGAPPTDKWSTLTTWSIRFRWQERAELYDAGQDAATTADHDKARKELTEQGAANAETRILSLVELAEFLEELIYEQDESGRHRNLWLKDIKGIGGVPMPYERFNEGLLRQYRGTLADIALEKGERAPKKVQITKKGDGSFDLVIETLREAKAAMMSEETTSEDEIDEAADESGGSGADGGEAAAEGDHTM